MRDDGRPSSADGSVENQLTLALGSPILAAKRTAWGFKNDTSYVRLEDGREVVFQVFLDRQDAAHRVNAMRQLAHLTELPIPGVLADDLDAPTPWAAYVRLEGDSGYERAGWDLGDERWPTMAREMGAVVRSLQAVPIADVDLPDLWARPEALSEIAYRWAAEMRPHYSASCKTTVRRLIDSMPDTLGTFTPVICHGDFGPQNVLFTGTTISAVLDLEDARLAHPLLDVAWWNWLVRAHTPAAFERSWDCFLEGAGINSAEDGFAQRVHTLTILRLLETAETFRRTQPGKHASWGARIEKELATPDVSR